MKYISHNMLKDGMCFIFTCLKDFGICSEVWDLELLGMWFLVITLCEM